MKLFYKTALLSVGILSLFSCDKDEAVNQEPTIPGITIPLNEAADVSKEIALKWKASEDPENGLVMYDVFLGTEKNLTEKNIKSKDLKETELVVNLSGHTKYFWKVVAKDDAAAVVETKVFSFTTANSSPEKAVASFPANEATDVAKDITFAWNVATDADADKVKYSIFLSETNEFAEALVADLESLEYAHTGLKAHTKYFWKVVSTDAEGAVVDGVVCSFTTMNTAPSAAVINKAVQTVGDDAVSADIQWTASTDADSDDLVYDLYVSKNESFEAGDLKKADISGVEFTLTGLEFTTAYNVKVITKDASLEVSSEVFSFTTDKKKEVSIYKSFTDARDGHVYKTILINGKTWLAENFAYIPYLISDDKDENRCSVFGVPIQAAFGQSGFVMPTIADAKAHENFAKYGVMYSAYALEEIAPEGWHVATDEEWKELEKFTGMTESEADATMYRGTTAHKFLLAGETTPTGATDEFGFGMVNGGYDKGMEQTGAGSYTYVWTNSTKASWGGTLSYIHRVFSGKKTGVGRNTNKSSSYRLYVRLVKD